MGFSIVSLMSSMFRRSFVNAGLHQDTVSIDSDTTIHCWFPATLLVSNGSEKANSNPKPVLLLIHAFMSNAMWQWNAQVGPLSRCFDIIVPDLIFFGGSTTSSSHRSEEFQAEAFTRLLDMLGVAERETYIAGVSYGGFIAYNMARSLGPKRVKRVVIASSDLLNSEEDVKELMARAGVDNLIDLLLPKNTKNLKTLLRLTSSRAPIFMPDFLLKDMLQNHYSDNTERKMELIKGVTVATKDFELTPLQQDVLVIWGEGDQICPIKKAYMVKECMGKATNELKQWASHLQKLSKVFSAWGRQHITSRALQNRGENRALHKNLRIINVKRKGEMISA